MTDAPDVDNMSLGSQLGTSDHCFVNCELLVEQVIPEHNIKRVVHWKHRINWDNIWNAVRSLSWSTILRSADPIGALNSAVSEVVSRFIPTMVVRSRSGGKHWFDSNCHRANDAKQTAYRAWSRERGADRWNPFVHSHTEAQQVYGVAMASHNERARRTLTSTTCSHKWWETLKGSIFSEKPSIPALRGLGGVSC